MSTKVQGKSSRSYGYSGSVILPASKTSGKKGKNRKGGKGGNQESVQDILETESLPLEDNYNISTTTMSARRSAPGVFTCQTCSALFTCLEYYQQHRKQHAESSGVKLLCCKHCPYSTENQFHFNWHVMSHTGEEIHSCSVCNIKLESDDLDDSCIGLGDNGQMDNGTDFGDLASSSNHHHHLKSVDTSSLDEDLTSDLREVDTEEEEEVDLLIGKRSVATMATDTDDLLVLSGSTDHRLLSSDGNNVHLSGTEDDATITFLTSSFSPSNDKKFHELSQFQIMSDDGSGLNYNGHNHHNHNAQAHHNHHHHHLNSSHNDISDEEDDEEEEIESEEDDDGLDDFVGNIKSEGINSNNHHHGHSNNQHHHNHHSEIPNAHSGAHEQENSSNANNANGSSLIPDSMIQQGPPYLKSPNAIPGTDPILGPDGLIQPISGRGRGKGNRKSRCISTGEDGEEGIRRKFHCSHCGKSFKTKSHLQRHILTHTGEKPYHCNRCGSKFNQSSSLRNHIIAIHTKEYPHFCPHCNKGFLMPALLTKHLSTNHRNVKNADGVMVVESVVGIEGVEEGGEEEDEDGMDGEEEGIGEDVDE